MKKLEKYLLEIQGGNTSVLDDIYALTSRALFSLSFSILKDKQLAEDALHNTYIIVMKSKNYKKGGNAFSWLYTVCKNCSLKIIEKQKNKIADYDLDTIPIQDFAELSENKIFLIQLLKKLESTDREIILLHIYADMKHKDIAALLNMPEGTVRYRYTTALKRLKEVIK